MIELKGVLPAIRNMKDFDRVIDSKLENLMFLETRISQLGHLVKYSKENGKTVFVHMDLIQGLKSDEYGMEYLIRNLKVDGIVSTRGSVIGFAKKNNVLTIQRLFALDSMGINHNIALTKKHRPDYIEVLPGIMPTILSEVRERTKLPIIAGGLIRSKQDVENAFEAGASAVTTSRSKLWDLN
ncbi:glycerol-3-phosphate responsive antiterminator [Aquibacillus saliphilus]|uniref:glycerol-3-phosphate responsive antiterminator n=1 Tax=Aquibacillus saliphilus TaxID=1909422 RepID=UPI001CF07252|nr:glycerol-3-phosphate responsive antiterminator [Aquibacillus saliphilus]